MFKVGKLVLSDSSCIEAVKCQANSGLVGIIVAVSAVLIHGILDPR